MKLLYVLVAIVSAVSAVPVKNELTLEDLLQYNEATRNTIIEQAILDIIEDLRLVMVNGSDDIPVLDPLNVEQINLDGELFGFAGSHIRLNKLLIENLSTFVFNSFSLSLISFLQQRYEVIIDLSIPVISVESEEYDLWVSALGLSVFGKGHGSLRVVQPRITGSMIARLSILSGFSISVESSDLKLHLEGFESELHGLFYDDNASDFANAFIGYLVPDLVQLYENEISELLNTLIPGIINGAIGRTVFTSKNGEPSM